MSHKQTAHSAYRGFCWIWPFLVWKYLLTFFVCCGIIFTVTSVILNYVCLFHVNFIFLFLFWIQNIHIFIYICLFILHYFNLWPPLNLCRPTGWSARQPIFFYISCTTTVLHMPSQWHHICVLLNYWHLDYLVNSLASNAEHMFMSWHHPALTALTLVAFNDPIITSLWAVEHIPWEINQCLQLQSSG